MTETVYKFNMAATKLRMNIFGYYPIWMKISTYGFSEEHIICGQNLYNITTEFFHRGSTRHGAVPSFIVCSNDNTTL